jgi:Uma2 family endonuclease
MPTLAPSPATKAKAARRIRPPRLQTAEEFLEWLQPKVYADLIGGEKFMHSPVNFRHATILNFLDRLLAGYIERKHLGRLDRENIAVRFSPRDVFMPDLCFFTNEQVARLLPTYATFAPALVVEALSPRTARRDVGPKFAAYERYGVEEYWVLDPENLAHRFYAREGELLIEFGAGAERIDSRAIPGFYLRRKWLDPAAIPTVEGCLREIVKKRPKRAG